MLEVLADVLQTTTETQDDTKMGQQVRKVFKREGAVSDILEQCEQVSAHHGHRYQPFDWQYYSSHPKALFRVLKVLDIHSTTADQALMHAVAFILEHEHDPKKYLEATINLSFGNDGKIKAS